MRDKNLLINRVVKIYREKIYYFDTEGIYRSITLRELSSKIMLEKQSFTRFFEGVYTQIGKSYCNWSGLKETSQYFAKINATVARIAINKLKEGDSIEDFERIFAETDLKENLPAGLNRFITKIEKPDFGREPENFNEKTFDWISIEVCTVTEWAEDKRTYIKKHLDDIKKMVLESLSKSRKFQSYNVPINFLRLTDLVIRSNSTMVFKFELKKF